MRNAAQAFEQRIIVQIADVPQPPCTDKQHANEKQNQRSQTQIAAQLQSLLGPLQATPKATRADETMNQLQTRVRRQLFRPKDDSPIALASRVKTALLYSHWKWFSVSVVFVGFATSKHHKYRDHFQFFAASTRIF
jgi:hypothetical protein